MEEVGIEMSKLSSSFAAIFKPTENYFAEPGRGLT
jgi:hypothetical protein